MAFPPGANIEAYKKVYMDQLDSSSSSSEDDLAKKAALFAKQTQGKNMKIVRLDRQISDLETKQRNLMVRFNELERELQQLKRDRKKVVQRLKEDSMDSFEKASAGFRLSITMARREAIEPPKKKKRAPIVESPSSSSSSSASEAEEDNEAEEAQEQE